MMRWHKRVMATAQGGAAPDEEHLDDLYAFFVTCHHLRDWLENDKSVAAAARGDLKALIHRERCLQVCADIANGWKHLRRHEGRAYVDARAHVTLAGSVVNEAFVADSAAIFADGVMEALPIVSECINAWEGFLTLRGLLQPARPSADSSKPEDPQ
jgi:hypothetical protein